MWKRFAILLLVSVLPLVTVAPAPARFLESWPYDRLFKHSDLVVLATAVKTQLANDKPPKHSWPFEFVSQNTTFKVNHALKGKADGERIKVLHFTFGELKKGVKPGSLDAILIENGPLLVAFRTNSVIVKAKGEEENTVLPSPEYLLFLKQMKDGRYEPVSGPIDPALSVKEVSEPLDKVLGGGK